MQVRNRKPKQAPAGKTPAGNAAALHRAYTRDQRDKRRAVLARLIVLAVALLSLICLMFAFSFGVGTPVGIGALALSVCFLLICVGAATKIYGPALVETLRTSAAARVGRRDKPSAAKAPPTDGKTTQDAGAADLPRHARSSHIAEDKKRAAQAANSLRSAGTIPEVPSPVGLDPAEVCHHARRAVLLRQRDGGLREVDRGHLVITDRRIFYAGSTVFSTIHYRDIRGLKFVTARSFSIMCGGAPDTFDVEYPREFLAYLGMVCHKRGINLPRVSRA